MGVPFTVEAQALLMSKEASIPWALLCYQPEP